MHILLLIIESVEFYDLHANISPKNIRSTSASSSDPNFVTLDRPVIFCKEQVLQQLFFQDIRLERSLFLLLEHQKTFEAHHKDLPRYHSTVSHQNQR